MVKDETKHKEIYEKYGTKYWYGKRLVLRKSIKESDICATIKKNFWSVVENEYRSLLNRQNAWDDEDENNRSHARIDVGKAVAEQKEIWFSQACTKQ
jgi:hypothetical protein